MLRRQAASACTARIEINQAPQPKRVDDPKRERDVL
jgi:hypothetical protein